MNYLNVILDEMSYHFKNDFIEKWYPKVIDLKCGGFFSNLTYDFELTDNQEKMIVTQSRHIWTLAKIAEFTGDILFANYALQGFNFIKDKMWDDKYGGFFQIRNREGYFSDIEGWRNEKRVYGNAYGLFGLSALYRLTKQDAVLDFAQEVFNWIDKYAHDEKNKGYFQFLTEDSRVFDKQNEYKSIASDSIEIGYKDQNSTIHLLEAFTEFYNVTKNKTVKERLEETLYLIRDVITTERGYLQLFFNEKWEPISFRNSPKEIREANYRLDHVSFGHDYETAFLLLEASFALGIKNDIKTLTVAKKMIDHALENGWDKNNGGFYEEGYYFNDSDKCKIIKDTKNWWAQAEALNIFLIMSKIFPEETKYIETFIKEWEYVKKYIIDSENGDWYWGGLDKEPFYKTDQKGTIWKGTYHNGRALMNCITILSDETFSAYNQNETFRERKIETNNFIDHWKEISKMLDPVTV